MSQNISYSVNSDLIIFDVAGPWDRVAIENACDIVKSDYILGTSLISHIIDDTTRMWCEAFFMNVFVTQSDRKVQYRCDTPTERRVYEMHAQALDSSQAIVSHNLVMSETSTANITFQYADKTRASIKRCSLCNRINLEGKWTDALSGTDTKDYRVYYGICPDCMHNKSFQR